MVRVVVVIVIFNIVVAVVDVYVIVSVNVNIIYVIIVFDIVVFKNQVDRNVRLEILKNLKILLKTLKGFILSWKTFFTNKTNIRKEIIK